MADVEATMTLRILTPSGVSAEVGCDSVQLPLRDDGEGRGGGLVGVQRNHAPAVMALGQGIIHASLGSDTVLEASLDDGFASVSENVITVLTDSVSRKDVIS